MKKLLTFVFILCASLSMSGAETPNFNTRLIVKLSQMMKAPVPSKVEIEVVSQEKLQDEYKGAEFNNCVAGNVQRLSMCSQYIGTLNGFVYGIWVFEKDPTHFHVMLYERAGVETMIHEYIHWWLHFRTEPKGLINSDQITEILTREIMASKEFIRWLQEK